MGNLTMIIEEPAWRYSGPTLNNPEGHTRVVWTTDFGDYLRYRYELGLGRQDETEDGHPIRVRYLPSVVMHEFGHAAGLQDLDGYGGLYRGYLMDDTHGFIRIPSKDIAYLSQVYRNEHGSEPHK